MATASPTIPQFASTWSPLLILGMVITMLCVFIYYGQIYHVGNSDRLYYKERIKVNVVDKIEQLLNEDVGENYEQHLVEELEKILKTANKINEQSHGSVAANISEGYIEPVVNHPASEALDYAMYHTTIGRVIIKHFTTSLVELKAAFRQIFSFTTSYYVSKLISVYTTNDAEELRAMAVFMISFFVFIIVYSSCADRANQVTEQKLAETGNDMLIYTKEDMLRFAKNYSENNKNIYNV